MKTRFLPNCIIGMSFLLIAIGCTDDASPYYKGTVISLNTEGNGCFNVIEITHSISNDLPINTTIGFNTTVFDHKLKIGDTVYFTIAQYTKWSETSTTLCVWPEYTGDLKQYK